MIHQLLTEIDGFMFCHLISLRWKHDSEPTLRFIFQSITCFDFTSILDTEYAVAFKKYILFIFVSSSYTIMPIFSHALFFFFLFFQTTGREKLHFSSRCRDRKGQVLGSHSSGQWGDALGTERSMLFFIHLFNTKKKKRSSAQPLCDS